MRYAATYIMKMLTYQLFHRNNNSSLTSALILCTMPHLAVCCKWMGRSVSPVKCISSVTTSWRDDDDDDSGRQLRIMMTTRTAMW